MEIGKKEGRQSKTMEINNLLQQAQNYSNEVRAITEDISITLLQQRVEPDIENQKPGKIEVSSQDPNSMGWFDSVIKKLITIKLVLEKTLAQLSKIHNETIIK